METGIAGRSKEGSFLATVRQEPQALAWFAGNRGFFVGILLSSRG